MASLQGVFLEPSLLGYPLDYYGNPTHKELLMRFDFSQIVKFRHIGTELETIASWNDRYPGRRSLGIAPSGRFAIYLLRWVPAGMSRKDLKVDLCRKIPPTDKFCLEYPERYHWMREKVRIPLVLPTQEPQFIEVGDVAKPSV